MTREQYREFEKHYAPSKVYARTPHLPVVGIDWYAAARYCNWLSEVEGVPENQWCYEINGNEIRLRANYLGLTGYRLPTEAEMEYATRAGAITARYFGETEELLPKYAWYNKNAQEEPWPVGSLRPNDFGLFDAQGNVFTWRQERLRAYPQDMGVSDDQDDILVVKSTESRGLRGGSFRNQASHVRSAYRESDVAAGRHVMYGFRLARTFVP